LIETLISNYYLKFKRKLKKKNYLLTIKTDSGLEKADKRQKTALIQRWKILI